MISGEEGYAQERSDELQDHGAKGRPRGRKGKHKGIVTKILSDLDQVGKGVAVKVPLAQMAESKEKVRSALNRATRKAKRTVSTASDEKFLYVWNED